MATAGVNGRLNRLFTNEDQDMELEPLIIKAAKSPDKKKRSFALGLLDIITAGAEGYTNAAKSGAEDFGMGAVTGFIPGRRSEQKRKRLEDVFSNPKVTEDEDIGHLSPGIRELWESDPDKAMDALMVPGQRQTDLIKQAMKEKAEVEKERKPLTPEIITKYANIESGVNGIKSIYKELQKSNRRNLTQLAADAGLPTHKYLQALETNVTDILVRGRSGQAVPEQEYERLKSLLPRWTDIPSAMKLKLNEILTYFVSQKNMYEKNYPNIYEQSRVSPDQLLPEDEQTGDPTPEVAAPAAGTVEKTSPSGVKVNFRRKAK